MIFIALKILLGDRTKYSGLLFGITFTSFLVTFAASYFAGMMTRSFALIAENPVADAVIVDPGGSIGKLDTPSLKADQLPHGRPHLNVPMRALIREDVLKKKR